MTTTAAPFIDNADTFDFASYGTDAVTPAFVKASALKAGMVLLDPATQTPFMVIDHRQAGARNSGDTRVWGYTLTRWTSLNIGLNVLVPVMSK